MGQGISHYCDSVLTRLGPFAEAGVAVDSVGGELGSELRHRLATSLTNAGISAHLDEHNRDGKLLLQTFIQDATLEYRSVGAGIFRQGRVMRVFTMSGYGRVLDGSGVMTRSLESLSVSVADTLDINAARAARGNGRLLAPEMPATLFQRLVEPGIVVSITGALVYIFFASR